MYASHELMYRAQYPFDTVSSPGYELVTIMQIFAANFILSAFLGFQFLYATLIMVACSQLQKLRTNLLDIKQELVPSGADSGSDGGEEPVSRSEDVFCRMQMQLNECVRHHQAILQYMRTLEDTLNFPFCGLFLMLLASLCFFSLSAVAMMNESVSLFMFLLTMKDKSEETVTE
ncbi:uncharacterized protein LOC111869572 isoform X3 [Cryptotermes secundus]|uniref:uncharacterized protein LOC111869572 isoform X3 n=1 Tax=Cryptotermes secundus TaxID=105785 RepID=UPI001454BFBD|nr:uncharacterized protein LOC111869572 isoform X3 [Cryptotermes secundus]